MSALWARGRAGLLVDNPSYLGACGKGFSRELVWKLVPAMLIIGMVAVEVKAVTARILRRLFFR